MFSGTSRELRPLDYAGLLDLALSLWSKNLPLFTSISAAVYVPIALLHMVALFLHPVGFPLPTFRLELNQPLIWSAAQMLTLLAPFLLSVATTAATTALLLGQQPTLSGIIGTVVRRIGPAALTALLVTVLTLAGLWCFVVPGLLVALACVFAPQVLLLEHKSSKDALSRSAGLVLAQRQWIRVVVMGVIVGLLIWVGDLLVSSAVELVSPNNTFGVGMRVLGADIFTLATTPFTMIATTLLYIDIRVRLEDYDDGALASEVG
ncbi:MAG: hypothetical protein EB084_08780 [Proteobacteria bacterium]|nr:hypothetical protein [Pseudomonadota bacterium]